MSIGSGVFTGQANYQTPGSEFNVIDFLIRQRMARANSAMPVSVVSCTNAGGVSPVGFVNVQPLVNQVDGAGNVQPYPVVYGIPYCRLQGGKSAIILDPQPGDQGAVLFCDRDISVLKANSPSAAPQPQPPGSRRRNDLADGVYICGLLNGTPTDYIQFAQNGSGTPNGITIVSTVGVTVTAPNVTVNATTGVTINSPTTTFNGNVVVTGSITAGQDIIAGNGGGDQVGLQTHTHPTAETGAPSSPTPGT